MDNLLNEIYYEGPKIFDKERLSKYPSLYNERLALIFTPTKNIPNEWIGKGDIEVILPLPMPNVFDLAMRSGYNSPKLWLDMLQRHTNKIRWYPNIPAKIKYTKYDSYDHGVINSKGFKGLEDSLKEKTSGRKDGWTMYYFGAIRDDNTKDLLKTEFEYIKVKRPKDAKIKIEVIRA